jgi:tetratricopeptide (TPR) repeat protein
MPYELESLLRADGDGPAQRIDGAAAQRLVTQAIDAAAVAQVKPLRGKRYAWLLVAALVITGSAAAMYASSGTAPALRGGASSQRAGDGPQHAARPRPIARAPQIAAQEPLAQRTDLAQGQARKPELEAPALPAPATEAEPAPAQAESGAGQVQDLLRRANRLRGDGQYRSAERTYLRVVAQSPNGAPAYSARVAAAALRIERLGDPRGALALYADALRTSPNGPLSPEIHEGMAQAYRKLDQPAREQKALAALLAEQADGPAAERARARLAQLQAAR